MRQPPSPLLLSARKRRPRRTPPRGGQYGTPLDGPSTQGEQQQAQDAPEGEKCALLERDPTYAAPDVRPDDDESTTSSR
jgi:hypothetical protein